MILIKQWYLHFTDILHTKKYMGFSTDISSSDTEDMV